MLARVKSRAGTAQKPAPTPRVRLLRPSLRSTPTDGRHIISHIRASGPAPLVFAEGFKEVEEVAGARIIVDSDTPRVEYLTNWKVWRPLTMYSCCCRVRAARPPRGKSTRSTMLKLAASPIGPRSATQDGSEATWYVVGCMGTSL